MQAACQSILAIVVACGMGSIVSAQAGTKGDLYDDMEIQDFELSFKQPNYWKLLNDNRVKKVYIKADLKHRGKVYRDVGVRFRGNSSWLGVVGKQKKPFKIKLDAFVPGQRVRGYRTLNLNNNFLDPSMMREPLCYWVLRKFQPASGCNFAKLTINGQNWGIYINAQQINKDYLPQWFENDGGIRYRGEWVDGEKDQTKTGLTWLGPSVTLYQRFYQIKTEGAKDPWTPLVRMIYRLNESGSNIGHALPLDLDVDHAIRYVVGCNLLPLHDSYTHFVAHNYWMYRDPKHSRFHILPWDLNNSLGCYPFQSTSQSTYLDPFYKSNDPKYPLVNRILANPDWKKRYAAHFRRILKEGYGLSVLKPKLDAWRKMLDREMRNDPKKLYNYQQWVDSFTKDVKVEIWVPPLERFIRDRANYLRNHWALRDRPAVVSTGSMNYASPRKPVLVWAVTPQVKDVKRVSCYWRKTGTWTRTDLFDDGKHFDQKAGDGVWAAFIPGQDSGAKIEYYFEAENHRAVGGTYGYFPAYASLKPKSKRIDWLRATSPIQLHEVQAKNVSGIRDNKGELEDWIELCNTAKTAQQLGGLYLTDDLDHPKKWKIPAGTVLQPGGTILIWADEDTTQGPLHANFKLSSNGETLALFAKDGMTMLDSIRFGIQRPDHSVGRVEDRAKSPWVTFGTPTPNRLNTFTGCGARSYDAFESSDHPMELDLRGQAKVGNFSTLSLYGAPANSWVISLWAASPGSLRLPSYYGNVSLLFGSPVVVSASARTNSRGELKSLMTYPSNVAGFRACVQTFAIQASGKLTGSNALEIRPCR